MRPLSVLLLLSSVLFFSAAAPAFGSLIALWDVEGETLAIGELDEDPGIDVLKRSQEDRLYIADWATGEHRYDLHVPQWYDVRLSHEIYLTDLEGDGRAELLVLQRDPSVGPDDALALLVIDRREFMEVWYQPWRPTAIEFAPILEGVSLKGPPLPREGLLCQLGFENVKVLDPFDGTELFDFLSQHVDPSAFIDEVEILDVILGGPLELLIHYSIPVGPDGPELHSMLIGVDTATAVVSSPMGSSIFLAPSTPNPTTHSSTIQFRVSEPGDVTLRIYSPAGRLVRTLIDGPMLAGRHQVSWNGRDNLDQTVSSGVYFYELQANQQRRTRKLVRLR